MHARMTEVRQKSDRVVLKTSDAKVTPVGWMQERGGRMVDGGLVDS
jgi:hypothetical protein